MILEMSRDDYLTLLDEAETSPDPVRRRRARVLVRAYDGWAPSSIHRFIGCSRGWIYELVDRYHAEGMDAIRDRRKQRVPTKATPEFMAQVVTLLKTPPQSQGWMRSTWSCELLSLQMRNMTEVSVHPAHLSRMLHHYQMEWNKPRPTVYPADPKEAIERIDELIEIVSNLGSDDVLVCEDEVDIHLNPKIGPMWMQKGEQTEVVTPGTNRKRYLAGSVDMKTGELVWVEGERKNSDLFISWLQCLEQRYSEAPAIYVVLDNFKIHDSHRTKKALLAIGGRVKLLFLPKYCPECNRMEHVWLQLHANVTRNHRCRSIDELIENVRAFMRAASPFPGSRPSLVAMAS